MQDHTREELKTYLFRGDVNGVNKLLASGDIESPDHMIDLYNDGDGGTLLMWACAYNKRNDISLIRDLVKNHNANVNAQGTHGLTAVQIAIARGLDRVLRFFVEEGRANLELRNIWGRTALHVACGHRNSSEEMVQCLLDNPADINAADAKGWTPLHCAAFDGKFPFARLLLADDRVNIEAIDEDGDTPLSGACSEGNAEIVELLLSNGANPNAEEHEDGWTPLVYAAHFGNTTCIQALIRAKVDGNTGDNNGQKALLFAVDSGNVDVVELLLKAKNRLVCKR